MSAVNTSTPHDPVDFARESERAFLADKDKVLREWHDRNHYLREDADLQDAADSVAIDPDTARFFRGIGFALGMTAVAGAIIVASVFAAQWILGMIGRVL